MYKIYILQSIKNNKFYIGYTSDIKIRLSYHNSKKNRSTKSGVPWELIYSEEYETKSEAIRREIEIKNYKGNIKF